ncbi:hypothetical protein [Megavirus chiliensis]|uniref:Uncharacterized protein n=2 Tax=Megamimivirinae TaxID=3044648 RepID=A0A2L2DP38_MIMIV|nr:hypothetical protein MegaChil _gp1103 [Megavirus chiliensis]AEQ32654.1 hypothetical protein [Megavirus chiliensis]AVG47938.1 hypothetical protein [Acanthamoeba polyphaga mimivirus]
MPLSKEQLINNFDSDNNIIDSSNEYDTDEEEFIERNRSIYQRAHNINQLYREEFDTDEEELGGDEKEYISRMRSLYNNRNKYI